MDVPARGPAQRGATAQLLDLALADATVTELRQVLDALSRDTRLVDRPAEGSVALRSLVLLANRERRALLLATNAVEQARAVAAGASLRQRVLGRYLEALASSPSDDAPSEPVAAETPLTLERAIATAYELTVKRSAVAAEIEIWQRNLGDGLPFHEFVLLMKQSDEAGRASVPTLLAGQPDGRFVQILYETILGRGAHPATWKAGPIGCAPARSTARAWSRPCCRRRWTNGPRWQCLTTDCRAGSWARGATSPSATGLDARRRSPAPTAPPDDGRHRSRFHIRGEPRRLVTAITSLYRGGEFIEQFMDNITSQTIFDDFAELVIVDAQSPDDEARTIERYLAKHRNIKYLRMDYRIGIYDAWNVGVQHARGEYLTNANLDDLRRHDSFELQAATLDNLPFVDVVYQDFHYSFDPYASPEQAAAFGYRSQLPVVTPHNMLSFNSPHNAPMWRKRLHDELGLFDTHFRSAGDYDFWLRCVAAGKTFYKLNDPHVVYYQNPRGLSTRPDSRGVIESREISAKYAPMLTSDHMLMERAAFDRCFGLTAPVLLGRSAGDRYAVVQERLRHAGRTLKFARRGTPP
jgi:glycosyltransferase involved in cell wall biosynthesis